MVYIKILKLKNYHSREIAACQAEFVQDISSLLRALRLIVK